MTWLSIGMVAAGMLSAVVGIGLLLEAVIGPGRLLTTALARILEVLDRQLRIERFIYRHHRLFGSAILIGSLAMVVLLGIGYRPYLESNLRLTAHAQVAVFLAVAMAVGAVVIGLVMLIRPSALKGFEALSNHWIEPFPAPGRLIAPSRTGMLLLALAFVCFAAV